MRHNKFLKMPFWFLATIPFYTSISLASEKTIDDLSQASHSSIQLEKPFVENVIAKSKSDKPLSVGEVSLSQRNYHEAFKWFKTSAGQDNKESMNYLVDMYWEGIGVEQDKLESIKILDTLARKYNSAEAQFRLADIFEEGLVIPKNDLSVITLRMRCLEGNLKEDQIKKTKTYLKDQFEYVKTEPFNPKYDEKKIAPLTKKCMEFWQGCPELSTIQKLMTLKSTSTSDVLGDIKIVLDFKDKFMRSFAKFNQADFMISCIDSKNLALKEQMKTNELIRSWTHKSTTYYTFGFLNVEKIDMMSAFLSPNASWQASSDNLLKWHENLLEDRKTNFKNNNSLLSVVKNNIKFLKNLRDIPEKMLTLLDMFAPERNMKFISKYPYFETADNSNMQVFMPPPNQPVTLEQASEFFGQIEESMKNKDKN